MERIIHWFASRGRREDGSVAVLSAAGIVAVMIAAALAVDIGRLASVSRDMQGDTDAAAYDAARTLGDLRDPNVSPLVAATAAAEETLLANDGGTRDSQVITVRVGDVDDSGNFVAWAGGVNPPTAVEVTNAAWVPFLFSLGSGGGGRTVTRVAIVELDPWAEISVGTTVATIDSDQGTILDALLTELGGGAISISAVGYEGLATTNVTLGSLLADLGITAGSPDTVLATSVSLADFATAALNGYSADGGADADVITALTTLSSNLSGATTFNLSDILNVTTGDVASAASAQVNLLDIVMAAVQAGNKQSAVSFSAPLAIPGFSTSTVNLVVIEPPQVAIGPAKWDATASEWVTHATTAQLRLSLDLELEDLFQPVGMLPIDVSLSLIAEAAQGRADLTDVVCRTPIDNSWTVVDTTTGAVGLYLGTADLSDLEDPNFTLSPIPETDILTASIDVLGVEVPVLELSGATELTVAESSRTDTITGPFEASTSGGTTVPGLIDLLDPADMTVTANVLGALPVTVADIQTGLHVAAATPLNDLETDLVGPLLEVLGVELGAADTTVASVDCSQRSLVK